MPPILLLQGNPQINAIKLTGENIPVTLCLCMNLVNKISVFTEVSDY